MHRAVFILILTLLAPGATGTTIYKSVDAQGRVTFSDQPPLEQELVDVIEYRKSRHAASALATERIEAMRAVTDRMAADRREREESRARARSARLATRPDTHYYDDSDYDGSYHDDSYYGYSRGYYPVYRPRPIRPGLRPPGVRPPVARPPIARPPLHHRPAHRQVAGFNQYPASLIRRHYTSTARRVFYKQPYGSH